MKLGGLYAEKRMEFDKTNGHKSRPVIAEPLVLVLVFQKSRVQISDHRLATLRFVFPQYLQASARIVVLVNQ
jgi:hypothetical protein